MENRCNFFMIHCIHYVYAMNHKKNLLRIFPSCDVVKDAVGRLEREGIFMHYSSSWYRAPSGKYSKIKKSKFCGYRHEALGPPPPPFVSNFAEKKLTPIFFGN